MANARESSSLKSDFVRDICLWRRKKPPPLILFISTSTWVLLNVYQFNFVTVASWAAMAIVTLLFLWGNLLRLLSKDEPEMSGLYVSEDFAVEVAKSWRELVDEAIRWMFRVSADRDLFEFAGAVFVLWVLSRIGQVIDLQTFLFIGTLMSLTVPVLWEKNKDGIKNCSENLKQKSRRVYEMADKKILKQMKNKLSKEDKIKKTE